MTLVPAQEDTIEALSSALARSRRSRIAPACHVRIPSGAPPASPLSAPCFSRAGPRRFLTGRPPQGLPFFSAGQISLMRTIAEYLGIARTTMLVPAAEREEEPARHSRDRDRRRNPAIPRPRYFPSKPKARVFGVSKAAFQVGGDYMDALTIGDGDVLIAIADVMGKGMPAALLATILRTSRAAPGSISRTTPGCSLSEVNRQISPDLAASTVSSRQIAFFSHESRELLYARAGHCPV